MTPPALPDDADRPLRARAGPCGPAGGAGGCTGDERQLFAKRHKNQFTHRRETTAYRNLAPALGPDRTPTLLTEDAHSLLVVTTTLPGTPVIKTILGPAQDCSQPREFPKSPLIKHPWR
ncbi:hypothetical protein ACFVX9_37255 [Kitasatospora sp. NPDC058243]|uniref:hypothetical protein n=1 Tax=Kitasatospora sp. NPDC058243 TaxID=3346397 RepID=UPI0036D94AF0